MDLQNKKVLVFGSGISGIGAVQLLEAVGASVILYDGNETLTKDDVALRLPKTSKAEILLGELPKGVLRSLDLVVVSPGVPLDIPAVEEIKNKGISIWGEIELAYRMGKGTILAVTGTNGKTTTTALLGEIIKNYASSVFVVGNIGNPYTAAALAMTDESYTVAEISSFQLETVDQFTPTVSAILNITEDHLNRHHTMEEYIRVKELITKNQSAKDVCVLNYDDEILRGFGKNLVPRVMYFSSSNELSEGIYLKGDKILLKCNHEETVLVSISQLKLLGKHNYENVMAAAAMAYSAGVPLDCIRNTICGFGAVEHRIEFVKEKNGVAYYNDSKGTNPDAAIKGVQAMNRPTLLIGGGYDKESVYDEWIKAFDGNVRYLVLIGQTRENIKQAAHRLGFEQTILADNLEEAVKICADKARPGDAVLLSPACASWGQFDNYEQRGNMFKEYVHRL